MDGMTMDDTYRTDESRWQAVQTRDAAAEGQFFYAVMTTGVFCRPTCGSRQPRRENVAFYDTTEAAQKAGWRPCKRCRPTGRSVGEAQLAQIRQACALIDAAETPPTLNALADAVGLSPYHFHRLFKAIVGVTPRDYAAAKRTGKLQAELESGATVTEAIYGAGYGSSSRLYEAADATLGMRPATFRAGARGETIRWSTEATPLGRIVVAATEAGICMIEFGRDEAALEARVEARFPHAETMRDDAGLKEKLATVAAFIDRPARGLDLPLDIQGTSFQRRVWKALQEIPTGATASYSEIAGRIGEPKAARAVAAACAANPVAMAVPCHRVIARDGSLSGYRWGVERKQALLDREAGK